MKTLKRAQLEAWAKDLSLYLYESDERRTYSKRWALSEAYENHVITFDTLRDVQEFLGERSAILGILRKSAKPVTKPAKRARKVKQITSGIIYEGPSAIDGSPIVVIATLGSKNSKTGDMLQTWIMRADMRANDAAQTGEDYSVCGNCPHRGIVLNGKNVKRTCYVRTWQAPRSISEKYLRGGYPVIDASEIGKGRAVRLGSYGDPAAVPVHVWQALVSESTSHTGYTHQWREAFASSLQGLCMASADSEAEAQQARALGWRTFRVSERALVNPVKGDEITCPASKEAGQKTTCASCGLCAGSMADKRRTIPSITIAMH